MRSGKLATGKLAAGQRRDDSPSLFLASLPVDQLTGHAVPLALRERIAPYLYLSMIFASPFAPGVSLANGN